MSKEQQIDQRVFDLYDEYCHGKIDRREFLSRSAAITIAGSINAEGHRGCGNGNDSGGGGAGGTIVLISDSLTPGKTVEVINTGVQDVTLTDLTDDVYGDLLDAGNSQVSADTSVAQPTASQASSPAASQRGCTVSQLPITTAKCSPTVRRSTSFSTAHARP